MTNEIIARGDDADIVECLNKDASKPLWKDCGRPKIVCFKEKVQGDVSYIKGFHGMPALLSASNAFPIRKVPSVYMFGIMILHVFWWGTGCCCRRDNKTPTYVWTMHDALQVNLYENYKHVSIQNKHIIRLTFRWRRGSILKFHCSMYRLIHIGSACAGSF